MQPTILTFVGHYLPGYKAGGPIRTVAAMVDQLGDDFAFHIVTADRDLGDDAPYQNIIANRWTPVGKAQVFYRSPGASGWQALRTALKAMSVDLIYLNSLFSPGATLRPLLEQRLGRLPPAAVLLAPRGELSLGALKVKAAKKHAFLRIAKAIGLYRGVTFHASSDHEANDIRRELGDRDIAVALDLSQQGGPLRDLDISPGSLRAVFLSRISPKKNLLGALEILKNVRVPITYDIYGIIEDKEYWKACEAVIAKLPEHVHARFRRELRPEEAEGVLAGYDFFFFPTLGENYGHVIREALSAGLPTLISDQTPWGDLKEQGAGAALPLDDRQGFITWIHAFAELSIEERQAMRRAAHARGNDESKATRDRENNRAMLYSMLQGSALPSPMV
ncbi:glycosyltransferase family 4 protein [Altererythrobacter sp. C41]|uniref:glycosyltransferase family 4 protein n=1 Tax=Altererythrobacter sp. C41 TaxID=2806021 RepID=UPI001933B7E4|nr:glycosyltransferase [Altererythrobacter sp. C41]MBM0171285.1 glycosyltransferase [Altererythrobacter sp. C41]